MQILLSLFLFLVMLGFLITIHELGHFLIAKLFNVYVFEFSIGFGPKLFRKKKGETYYSLRALPLGGYVAMLGEADSVPEEFKDAQVDLTRSLVKINRGKRAAIMSAGIIMNLILGYGIFLFANGVLQQTQLTPELKIAEGSDAALLGIQDGDFIQYQEKEVDGYTIQYFGEGTISSMFEQTYYVMFSPESYKNLDFGGVGLTIVNSNISSVTNNDAIYKIKDADILTFTANILRGEAYDEAVTIPVELIFNAIPVNPDNLSKGYVFESIGLSLSSFKYRNSFVQTFKASNRDFTSATTAVVRGLKSLFTQGLTNISGPVGIFSQSTTTLQNFGFGQYLFLWGLISVNLALFNLLPFPPLDGWHLLVTGVEAITRQEISPKFKQIASAMGAILLILLTVVILFKDIFLIGVL